MPCHRCALIHPFGPCLLQIMKRFSIQAFMLGGQQTKATTADSTAELLRNVSDWEQKGCLWFTASDGAEEQVTGHTDFDDLPTLLVWRAAGTRMQSEQGKGHGLHATGRGCRRGRMLAKMQ